ncbi:Subtilisin-like protease SBT1.7 [Vitis vinifera]|uniref:Subtilisin-like protease SBT1.7 n=1 Tax=Vitis vinifera TaxID=29760 RepID=A0A438GJ48_VITVI|nr:Subtilisin-like protease SBT1.7 [Vitis vinifera]
MSRERGEECIITLPTMHDYHLVHSSNPETLSQFQTRSGFIISASLDAFRFIKGYPSIQLHPAAHVPHGRAWPPQSYALPNIPLTTKLPSGYLFSEITRSDTNKLIALNWMTRLRRIQKWRAAEKSMLKTYIVHVNDLVGKFSEQSEVWRAGTSSFCRPALESENQQRRLLYSYWHVISGFVARLTKEEVKAMEKKDAFVSATPKKFTICIQLAPLVSWDCTIGMPPPPAKWTGTCEFNRTACNNKLIGARNFDSLTPKQLSIDVEGHGTHTASTAAGNYVKHANMYGNAKGTAAGIAPRAHMAVYKVCCLLGYGGNDILVAYDAAIEDGVDVLSLSFDGESSPFYDDPVALGAFAAIRKGIFVSCSAGNSGPAHFTLSNEAPWIPTIAASTLDRSITVIAKLGNTEEFDGESLYHQEGSPFATIESHPLASK